MPPPEPNKPERSLEELSRLVEDNMALAWHFAHKWKHLDPDEAFSIAMDGLLRAARDWQQERGVPFGSYASLRIAWNAARMAKARNTVRRGGGTAVMLPLDALLAEGSDTTFGDLMEDERAACPDRDNYDPNVIRKLLARLKPKEREVIERRFALNGHQEQRFRDIGPAMGLTYQRIQQLEKHAVSKLRAWIEGKAAPTGEPRNRRRVKKKNQINH